MKSRLVGAKVTSIMEQINALRFQIDNWSENENLKFTALKGMWKGKTHFSMEDIKQAEIRLKGAP